MKKIFTLLLVICSTSVLLPQSGFNSSYEFERAGVFSNIIHDQGVLILTGDAKDTITNKWGMLFAKIDTLGNLLDYRIDFGPLEDHYLTEANYGLIKTEDGGYASTGVLFGHHWGFMMKYDSIGNLIFFKDYPDDQSFTTHQQRIYKLSNDYLISGTKQKLDYTLDIFVMRTDSLGNKLWEKSYGEAGQTERLTSMLQLDENSFIIGGYQNAPPGTPEPLLWRKMWIFEIDSLGNVQWEWENDVDESIAGVYGINQTEDGGWIFATGKIEQNEHGDWGERFHLMRMDSEMNIVWQHQVTQSLSWYPKIIDIKPTPDGNYIAVGQKIKWINQEEGTGHKAGWLYKFSPEGETIWERLDSAYLISEFSFDYHLGGVAVLPSGSIVAAGYFNDYYGPPLRSYGWLFKVDKNGCMSEDDCPVTAIEEPPISESEKISVYPNPATEKIFVSYRGEYDVLIYDIYGRQVYEKKGLWDESSIDVNHIHSGIYFLEVRNDDRVIGTSKVVICE